MNPWGVECFLKIGSFHCLILAVFYDESILGYVPVQYARAMVSRVRNFNKMAILRVPTTHVSQNDLATFYNVLIANHPPYMVLLT